MNPASGYSPVILSGAKDLVVCAVRWETFFLGTSLPVVTLGMGAQRSRQNLEKAILKYSPRRIVLAGFSGAVRQDQRVGDIALPEIFCAARDGCELKIPTDADLRARMEAIIGDMIPTEMLGHDPHLRSQIGSCPAFRLLAQTRQISVAHIASPLEKCDIGRRWPDACGVDMESFAVASICADRGIALTCVRAVFDEADQRLSSWNNFWRLPSWYLKAASHLAQAIRCCLTESVGLA